MRPPVAPHQEIEIAHQAPTVVGIEAVCEPDRTLEQHRFDAGPIQNTDRACKLVAKFVVALQVRDVDGLQKRAQALVQICEQTQISHGRRKSRQDHLVASMANDALPIERWRAHDGLKLVGWSKSPQPLAQDAGDQIGRTHALRTHCLSKIARTHSMARSKSP
jgi:hypothetical protein